MTGKARGKEEESWFNQFLHIGIDNVTGNQTSNLLTYIS